MKKFMLNFLVLSAWCGAFSPVGAQTAAITVNGFVNTFYSYNFTNSDNGANGSGNNTSLFFDNAKDDSFTLGLAEVSATATQGQVGLHLILVDSAGNPLGLANPGIDLWQAWVSYNPGEPGEWTFRAGRFATWMGYESVESQNNWNYTHSLFFVYGIPHWHTGLGVAYAPTTQLSVAGYVVDGWNNTSTFSIGSGAGKTYGLDLGFTPDSTWGFNLKGVAGPSAQDAGVNGSEAKFVGEIVIRFNATDKLSFAVDAGYVGQIIPGAKTDAIFNQGKDAWFTTVYGRYKFENDWAVALRVDDVDEDQDLLGLYGGIGSLGTATDVEAFETTLTLEHQFTPNLLMRLEPRLDMASSGGSFYSNSTSPRGPFAGGNGSQFTTTVSAVVSF